MSAAQRRERIASMHKGGRIRVRRLHPRHVTLKSTPANLKPTRGVEKTS